MRAVVALLLAAACGGGDRDPEPEPVKDEESLPVKKKPKKRGADCGALFEKLQSCGSGRKGVDRLPDEDTFRSMCEKALDKEGLGEEMRAGIECAQRDTCEEFQTCERANRGKKRARSLIKDLEANRIHEAFSTCSYNPEFYADATFKAACLRTFERVDKVTDEKDLQRMGYSCSGLGFEKTAKTVPEFAKACRSLAAVQVTRLLARVTEARDAGKRDYSACSTLETASKTLDGNRDGTNLARAKKACAEMAASENAARGISEARANVAAKRSSFPFQCRFALDELARIDSPWAKTRGDELAKACYVELGAVVLELEVPKMRYSCPFQVREWMREVAKHKLVAKFPELEAAMRKLPPKCTGS